MNTEIQYYPPFSVGVDLGGTNTALALVDSVGHIICRDNFSTHTSSSEEWADILADRIRALCGCLPENADIVGLGIGAPCANTETGCIEAATDLPWPSPIPLVTMMEARLGLRTFISNDANAAALGEMTYGAAVGLKNFIVLTLGTGVGGGVVCDGHLLNGRNGFAAELGHVTFHFAADRLCGCGRHGCLETVASAKGIQKTVVRYLTESDEESLLRAIPMEMITAKDVAKAAEAGDPLAKRVFDFTGRCLGKAAAEFAAFTDPEAFILFGGVANAGDLLLVPMREAFIENALHLYRDRVRFRISGLNGADAAILGAAALPCALN